MRIGDEGGFAPSLESNRAALDLIGEAVEVWSQQQAWLARLRREVGMVTEALLPVLGRKVVGICDSAGGLVQRAARAAPSWVASAASTSSAPSASRISLPGASSSSMR